jgi:hypothetical protein
VNDSKHISTNPLADLRESIRGRFNLNELRILTSNLNVPFEEIEGETHQNKVQSLLEYVVRHDRMPDLLHHLKIQRPTVNWERLVSAVKSDVVNAPFSMPPSEPIVLVPRPLTDYPDHTGYLIAICYVIWIGLTFVIFSGQSLLSTDSALAQPDVDDPLLTLRQLRWLFLAGYGVFTIVLAYISFRVIMREKQRIIIFIRGGK